MDPVVKVSDLSVSYNGKNVFDAISLSVYPGQLVGIIGPNGAGKSTLIKAIMGLTCVNKGEVEVMNKPVARVRKHISYVPQRSTIDLDFPVLVEDVVSMGRYPHLSWWGFLTAKDRKIVEKSLRQVGIYEYRRRQIGQLSGGQQQRVFLARALAQEAELFFLDEPFAGIDVASEDVIMGILRSLRDQGKTLFVVHHDLSKAGSYFDSLILLKNKLIAHGKKEDVFKISCLKEAYDGQVTNVSQKDDLVVVNG